MNKANSTLHKLLYDNRALMMLSVVFAVIIWFVVAISFSPQDTKTIKDVKVSIDLANSVPAQFDLQMFGETEFYVDVVISGKRYVINSNTINENSIKVTAQTAYVDSAGKHTLQLKATKANDGDEFTIVSISESYVEAFFDVYDEGEFNLTPEIIADDEIVPDGFVTSEPILSINTVTISGPATEVSAINKVVARIELDKQLEASETYDSEIIAFDEYGNIFRRLTINYGNSDVTMTVPVYKVVTTNVSVTFKNSPAFYVDNPLDVSIEPANVLAGVSTAIGDSVKSLVLASVDFKDLKPGKNRFEISADEIPNAIVLDENVNKFTVTVNVPSVKTVTVGIPLENISFINLPQGLTAASAKSAISSVTVVGPENELETLTSADVFAEIDLSAFVSDNNTGKLPIKGSIKNHSGCWVSGNYTVDFTVS